jgi:hypothetical protein
VIVGKRALPADGLGPLLGRLAAGEILHGNSSQLLAAFRPDRFGAEVRAPAPVAKLLEQGGD